MAKEKQKPDSPSGHASSSTLSQTGKERSFETPATVKASGQTLPQPTRTVLTSTIRGRKTAGKQPEKQEKVIPSTLLFAHMPIDHTIKKYPSKAKRPAGAPAFAGHQKRSVTTSRQGDNGNADAEMWDLSGGESDDGELAFSYQQPEPISDFHNKVRVEGGRPASGRKITAELNSDDEIIVRMKKEKRTDREIAQTLADAGRVKYNYKTIGSRWKRLRTVLANKLDDELDRNEAHWGAADDEALFKGVEFADRVVWRLKQEADEQKWEIVTQKLREVLPTAIYSKKACQERFEGLANNTATCPIELRDEIESEGVQKEQQDKQKHEAENQKEPRNSCQRPLSDAQEVTGQTNGADVPQTTVGVQHSGAHADNRTARKRTANGSELRSECLDPRNSASEQPTTIEQAREKAEEDGNNLSAHQNSKTLSKGNDDCQFSIPRPTLKPVLREPSALSYRTMIAREAEKPDPIGELEGLKDVDLMTKIELRNELKARGLARDGVKETMVATVRAARAGATNLKPSPIRGDLNLLSLGRDVVSARPDLEPTVIQANRDRYIDGALIDEAEPAKKRARAKESDLAYQLDGIANNANHETHRRGGSPNTNPKIAEPAQLGQSSAKHNYLPPTAEKGAVSRNLKNDTTAAATDVASLNQASGVSDDRVDSQLAFAIAFPSYIFEVGIGNAQAQGPEVRYHDIVWARRRLFFSNFPADFTTEDMYTMLKYHAINRVRSVGSPGIFVVDVNSPMVAKSVLDEYDRTIIKEHLVAVDNAADMASAHQRSLAGLTPTTGVSRSPSLSDESSSEDEFDNDNDPEVLERRVIVSNVPRFVTLQEIHIVLGRPLTCDRLRPGVYLAEFATAGEAFIALGIMQGFRLYSQPLSIMRAPPPSNIGNRHSRRAHHRYLDSDYNMSLD
ncbi:hypothetical protein MMC13_004702 [Lambiella insularis]|nr:hypothetical protein [Lambiella insularis]